MTTRTVYRSVYGLSSARGVNLWEALIKYRTTDDRVVDPCGDLIGSRTRNRRHLPILDLDAPHRYVPSSTPGHAHLYLDVEISNARWLVLMFGLYASGVIERGFFWWSMRRGQNFARKSGVLKECDHDAANSRD